MQVGNLYRFEGGRVSMRLYGRVALYLGEAFIHRSDGVTVENHKILMVGETSPRIIDRGLLSSMTEVAA
jgi:hypothetical protein